MNTNVCPVTEQVCVYVQVCVCMCVCGGVALPAREVEGLSSCADDLTSPDVSFLVCKTRRFVGHIQCHLQLRLPSENIARRVPISICRHGLVPLHFL